MLAKLSCTTGAPTYPIHTIQLLAPQCYILLPIKISPQNQWWKTLQDLVSSFGINRATTLLLAGSGSGARFVRNDEPLHCNFPIGYQNVTNRSSALATVVWQIIIKKSECLVQRSKFGLKQTQAISGQGRWLQLWLCGKGNGWGEVQNKSLLLINSMLVLLQWI